MRLAMFLLIILTESPVAEEKPPRGDPTKKKDQPPIVRVEAAIKQTIKTGETVRVKWTVPLNVIQEAPAVPRGRLSSVTYHATANGGKAVPSGRRWRFVGTRRGKTKIVYKVYRDGKGPRQGKVIIELTVK